MIRYILPYFYFAGQLCPPSLVIMVMRQPRCLVHMPASAIIEKLGLSFDDSDIQEKLETGRVNLQAA